MSLSRIPIIEAKLAYLRRTWPSWLPSEVSSFFVFAGGLPDYIIENFYDIVATLERDHEMVNAEYLDSLWLRHGILGKKTKYKLNFFFTSAPLNEIKQDILQLLDQGGPPALFDYTETNAEPEPIDWIGETLSGTAIRLDKAPGTEVSRHIIRKRALSPSAPTPPTKFPRLETYTDIHEIPQSAQDPRTRLEWVMNTRQPPGR